MLAGAKKEIIIIIIIIIRLAPSSTDHRRGLRMTNETIRVATGLKLGTKFCEVHEYPCGKTVECGGTHGLSCRRSAGRATRHNAVNEIIWRRMRRAKIPASKEPIGLLITGGKRPDGVTLIPHWEVSSLERHNARHICSISSINNGLESWISRQIVSHAEDPTVCQDRADSYLHTGRHIDVWCIKHSSERTTNRTRKKTRRDHKRSERNYLPLPASVTCNTKCKHALFHGVFRHQRRLIFIYKSVTSLTRL